MAETDFERGYVIACANLVNLHDEPAIAADVMAQLGISWGKIRRLGLDEYDMRALRKIKAEHSREPFEPSIKGGAEVTVAHPAIHNHNRRRTRGGARWISYS